MPSNAASENQGLLKTFGKSITCAFCFSSLRKKRKETRLQTPDVIPIDVRRRRVALQACGLLEQSRIYGDSRLYSDVVPVTDISSGPRTEEKKAVDGDVQEPTIKSRKEDLLLSEGTSSPAPPYTPLPTYETGRSESFSSNVRREGRTSGPRIRRIGSVADEINNIDDEESRRLTEVAYLC